MISMDLPIWNKFSEPLHLKCLFATIYYPSILDYRAMTFQATLRMLQILMFCYIKSATKKQFMNNCEFTFLIFFTVAIRKGKRPGCFLHFLITQKYCNLPHKKTKIGKFALGFWSPICVMKQALLKENPCAALKG